jgi:hypothetical protein
MFGFGGTRAPEVAYDSMNPTAKPNEPRNAANTDDSFSRTVAPILAGFSLPSIIVLVTTPTHHPFADDVVLSCLLGATGLFLAAFQLSIGQIYNQHQEAWSVLRAGLSFCGIFMLVLGLTVLVTAVAGVWWVTVAAVLFGLIGVGPILMKGQLRLKVRRAAKDRRQASSGP